MKSIYRRIFSVCILLCAALCGIAAAGQKHPYSVEDELAIKTITDAGISPDGKWVAYVEQHPDMKEDRPINLIYQVAVGGGDPIQLTTTDSSSPRWSPDNRSLAFLSERKDSTQVYLLSRGGGEATQLTKVKQGVKDFEWSPDGKKLALSIMDADPDDDDDSTTDKPIVITRRQFKYDGVGFVKDLHTHIYVFDVATKTLKQVTSGPYDDSNQPWSYNSTTPRWSPDGKWIAFSSNRTPDPDSNRNSDIFVVSAEGGEPRKLTSNPGMHEAPQWSPDGKSIAYLTMRHPEYIWYDDQDIGIVPVSGGPETILTPDLNRLAWELQFSPDGKRLYFCLEADGTRRLASVKIDGSDLQRNVGVEDYVSRYDLKQNVAALIGIRWNLPGDIFIIDKTGERQLTHINQKVMDSVNISAPERIRFASKDGTMIDGFVSKPVPFDPSRKYPLILQLHGGPDEQYSVATPYDQVGLITHHILAAAGYVTLEVNFRGSSGYGLDFAKSIFADWGNKDLDDALAGVDYVIAQGYVDPEKLGVGGWSYGSILTNYVITKTQRFKAAVSGAGESNMLANYGVDQYQFEWEQELGLPWEKTDRYLKLSSFFKVANVKTPTLILVGSDDNNVPPLNSEQMYQALRRLGIDTMLIIYPDMPHVPWRPSYWVDQYKRYLAWYGHYLQSAENRVPKAESKAK